MSHSKGPEHVSFHFFLLISIETDGKSTARPTEDIVCRPSDDLNAATSNVLHYFVRLSATTQQIRTLI